MTNGFFFLALFSLLLLVKNEDYKSYITNLNLNLEEVEVITEDRYINTIWILTSKARLKRNGESLVLQHGLLDGAFTWLILGQDSLAKKLCEEGYSIFTLYKRYPI